MIRKKSNWLFLAIYAISVSLVWQYTKNPSINEINGNIKVEPSPLISGKVEGAKNEDSNTVDYIVSRVVDGDTIVLENGEKVRYIGIDTPETKDPRKSVQCFGEEAYLKNKELVEGKKVHLEKDVSEKDVYGRLLRYVWVSSSVDNDNKIFVNNYLVKEGYAHEASYPPDVKYQEQFLQAQNEARTQNKGLWSKCQSSIQTNKNK